MTLTCFFSLFWMTKSDTWGRCLVFWSCMSVAVWWTHQEGHPVEHQDASPQIIIDPDSPHQRTRHHSLLTIDLPLWLHHLPRISEPITSSRLECPHFYICTGVNPCAVSMLGQRRRRWPNIETTQGELCVWQTEQCSTEQKYRQSGNFSFSRLFFCRSFVMLWKEQTSIRWSFGIEMDRRCKLATDHKVDNAVLPGLFLYRKYRAHHFRKNKDAICLYWKRSRYIIFNFVVSIPVEFHIWLAYR